jgi:hypothetical protein
MIGSYDPAIIAINLPGLRESCARPRRATRIVGFALAGHRARSQPAT